MLKKVTGTVTGTDKNRILTALAEIWKQHLESQSGMEVEVNIEANHNDD